MSKLHTFRVGDPWFAAIQNGTKTYEGRRWWPKTKALKLGDFICFQRNRDMDDSCIAQVRSLHIFTSFEAGLKILGLDQVLPGIKTIDEGVKIYLEFVSQATQDLEGVCMIGFELCET